MREVVVKRLCRTHGGHFVSPKRRGRPPTSCAPDYPCSAVETHVEAPKRTRKAAAGSDPQAVARLTAARASESHAEPRSQSSEGLTKAKAAKAALVDAGWVVEGRAWTDEDMGKWVSVTAVRGEELLSLVWDDNGNSISQDYSLWNTVRVSANGAPKAHLPFDPDEIPDARLVPYLAGMKLTWFNKLKGGAESAYAGQRIEIMHVYDSVGDEMPSDRTIRFIDVTNSGYRAFRLGALLKVGVGKPQADTEDDNG